MAGFEIGFAGRTRIERTRRTRPHRVRIGALSVFSLVIVISLAVLAVLAFTTANASLVMSQRQAQAEAQRYEVEAAAQEFVANLDGVLLPVRQKARLAEGADGAGREGAVAGSNAATDAVAQALEDICERVREASARTVQVDARIEGDEVCAEFECGNGRKLTAVIQLEGDGTFHISQWKMSAVQNQEQAEGKLLIVE